VGEQKEGVLPQEGGNGGNYWSLRWKEKKCFPSKGRTVLEGKNNMGRERYLILRAEVPLSAVLDVLLPNEKGYFSGWFPLGYGDGPAQETIATFT